MSLSDARDTTAAKKVEVSRGQDPAGRRQEQRLAETIGELADLYLLRHAAEHKEASSAREDRKMLDCDVLPAWRRRKAAEIKRADVIALLDDIVTRGAKVKANRVRSLLSKLFNFGIERAIVETNPVQGVTRRAQERPRERCLSDAEIV